MALFEINTNDEVRVEWWCECRGQYALNQRWYRVHDINGFGPVGAESFLAMITTQVRLAYQSILPEDARFYGSLLQKVLPNATAAVSMVVPGDGAWTGNAMPTAVASLVRMHALSPTNRRSGRTYLPFPPLDAMGTDGRTTDDYHAALLGWVNLTLENLVALPDPEMPILVKPITRLPVGGTRRAFDNFLVRRTFASMRSRSMFYGDDEAPF